MASVWMGVFWGVLGTVFFLAIAGALWWVFHIIHRAKYNYFVRIKNWTAGRPYVEYYYGRRMKHKELGDIIFIPSLKKKERHIIQYFGTEHEYPTHKNKILFLPVTYYKNTYCPEQYDPYEDVEIEQIEAVGFDKEKKPIYEKIKKKYKQFIVRPTKASMRQFNLAQDVAIKEEYALNPGWWQKYGHLVLSFGIVGMAMVVSVFMIIMAYQWGIDLSQNQPEWVGRFLETASSNIAPPTEG